MGDRGKAAVHPGGRKSALFALTKMTFATKFIAAVVVMAMVAAAMRMTSNVREPAADMGMESGASQPGKWTIDGPEEIVMYDRGIAVPSSNTIHVSNRLSADRVSGIMSAKAANPAVDAAEVAPMVITTGDMSAQVPDVHQAEAKARSCTSSSHGI